MKYVFMTDVSCDLTQKQVDEVGEIGRAHV